MNTYETPPPRRALRGNGARAFMKPTIAEMISELEAAGWKRWKNNATIWVSPWGALFRGPAGAWKIMIATEPDIIIHS